MARRVTSELLLVGSLPAGTTAQSAPRPGPKPPAAKHGALQP
jgi:hypothetical protein